MARLTAEFRAPRELTVEDIEAIVSIARRQIEVIDRLEAALQACDDLRALDVARELVGLERKARRQN
jgi:hypothetical protein